MRSEGFLFLTGGSGGGTVFVSILGMRPRAFASDRARSRTFAVCPMRCALRIGLDGGRLGGALCRSAVGIGGGLVMSDALCRWDWPVSGLSGGSVTALFRWDYSG